MITNTPSKTKRGHYCTVGGGYGTNRLVALLLTSTILIASCGGSSDSPVSPPTNGQIENSKENDTSPHILSFTVDKESITVGTTVQFSWEIQQVSQQT